MDMRNMRKYILFGLFLLVGMTTQLAAQEKKAAPTAPKAKEPLAYEAFFKQEMRKIGEVLPIYTNDKQYYLEISKENLDRDLLVVFCSEAVSSLFGFQMLPKAFKC